MNKSGTDNCNFCDKVFSWKADVFNEDGHQHREYSSAERAEIVFVGEGKAEIIVSCPKCLNKNKYIVKV